MTGRHRRRSLIAAAARWMLLGLGVGAILVTRGPILVGHTTLTVMSGSMEPTIGTGDVIVEERIAPGQARIGDVVTFQDPAVPGRLLTHRVRGMRVQGDSVELVTRGDANTASEQWSAPLDGTIGRVRYRIPLFGYLVHWLGSGMGRVLMLVGPALALAVVFLRDIWRTPAPARVRS